VDDFLIHIKWKGWNQRDGEFGYLLAYPDGTMVNQVVDESYGILVGDHNRTAENPGCKFWICVKTPTGYDVRPISGDCAVSSLKDYEEFKKTDLWNECLLPELTKESKHK
jgi:hypothetical protein